jgi:HPt (histidine-containing phosphotransfer) domain-containing protein
VVNRDFALDQLGGDEGTLAELMREFLDDYQRLLGDIEKGVEERQAAVTVRAAHSLKGALQFFGAIAASELCGQVEDYARQNELNEAESVYPVFEAAVNMVAEELSRILESE